MRESGQWPQTEQGWETTTQELSPCQGTQREASVIARDWAEYTNRPSNWSISYVEMTKKKKKKKNELAVGPKLETDKANKDMNQ